MEVLYSFYFDKKYKAMELDDDEGEAMIEIPFNLTIYHHTHPINDIVNATYPKYIDEEIYFSAYSICKVASNIQDQDIMYPIEFLNSLKFSGIPIFQTINSDTKLESL
jgi:hypothetical protein